MVLLAHDSKPRHAIGRYSSRQRLGARANTESGKIMRGPPKVKRIPHNVEKVKPEPWFFR